MKTSGLTTDNVGLAALVGARPMLVPRTLPPEPCCADCAERGIAISGDTSSTLNDVAEAAKAVNWLWQNKVAIGASVFAGFGVVFLVSEYLADGRD